MVQRVNDYIVYSLYSFNKLGYKAKKKRTRAGCRFEGGLLFVSGPLLCKREEKPVEIQILKI